MPKPMVKDSNVLIATIVKNPLEEIRVSRTVFKGRDYVDVRTYMYIDGQPEKVPTKKGITINPDDVQELIEALIKAAPGSTRVLIKGTEKDATVINAYVAANAAAG